MKSKKIFFSIFLMFVAIMFISCFEDDTTESEQSNNTTQQQESKPVEVIPQTYEDFLKLARGYELKKEWCYALGAYYDALGTDELPENKQEAINGYNKLCNAILNGNPGLGDFNAFSSHEGWKELRKNAEKFIINFNPFEITVGDFIQKSLNYESQTATYTVTLVRDYSDRYLKTLNVILKGYNKAYREDWNDLSKEWNLFPSWNHYTYKFGIVDNFGKKIYSLNDEIEFEGLNSTYVWSISGFTANDMELIEQGKLFINPEGSYYNNSKKLPSSYDVFFCWNNSIDKSYENNVLVKIYLFEQNMVDIPGKGIVMSKTETPQDFYTMISGEDPTLSSHGDDHPVNGVTWSDVIYFCNKLSQKAGYTPVYAVNGQTDITKWNYKPHNWTVFGNTPIIGDITQDSKANGFRLPTLDEWIFAAKGGEDYKYAGSNKASEVAWFTDTAYNVARANAQKKSNGYGLYDMSGNVEEWVWDAKISTWDGSIEGHYVCGGSCRDSDTPIDYSYYSSSGDGGERGFRLVRNK